MSGWYFDFSWYLGLDRSIFHLIYTLVYVNEFYVLYEVRLILVYTYECFCNLFVQFNKKNTIIPPPFNSQNKTSPPDVQRRKLFVAKSGIVYIHTVCAARAEIQGVFFIVRSRLSEPQWPSKLEDMVISREFSFLSFIMLYNVALVELLAALLRVRTQERVCMWSKRQYSYI